MNINPETVLHFGYIKPAKNTLTQQVGIDVTTKNDLCIPPHKFAQVESAEEFNMRGVFAIPVARSTYNRRGILMPGCVIDPGYKGTIWMSIYNFTDEPFSIYAGTRVMQVVFFRADAAKMYDGQYQNGKTR